MTAYTHARTRTRAHTHTHACTHTHTHTHTHTRTRTRTRTRYYDKVWDGKLTYHKANKSSQIDFVFTNKEGRKQITQFSIIETKWHLSDHLPLVLKLNLPFRISTNMILARAIELNNPLQTEAQIPSCRFKFDFEQAKEMIEARNLLSPDILDINSPDLIISTLDEILFEVLGETKVKKETPVPRILSDKYGEECDVLFVAYINKIQNQEDETTTQIAYANYQEARNKLNIVTFKHYEDKYKLILEEGDNRKLWSEINWAGKHKDHSNQQIPIQVVSDYFERLYQPIDINERREMEQLQSATYIPANDDPITSEEIHFAASKMKKGGYDYSLDVLKLLMSCLSPLLLILFNLVFYVSYPLKFGLSVLSTIPKKGNLKLLSNYRGIHMQNLLSLVYDRILANRLILWARIHPEQTAFQKEKSTLNHIFLLRILSILTKQAKLPLYIGFFDLEKAFDKVSRPLLLKSLLKLGIGCTLFYAIKAMYTTTRCITKSGKKLSDIFLTHSGIKQGAPSSVILFVIFMDEFIDVVRDKCIKENVLDVLHIILHADDTAVLSTDRELFIGKCNTLITAFKAKKVSLNLKKSSFLVMYPDKLEDRRDIKLESGWLKYSSTYVYLGVIISDTGSIANDLDLHTAQREKSVFVKMANFMRNNQSAPINVKCKVLNSCLNASLLYGCEVWSSASLRKLETLYRKAIKITYNMNINTPNQLIFVETGLTELKSEVYKRQFNFWLKMLENVEKDPASQISRIINTAMDKNIFYIKHYKNLVASYRNADECYVKLKEEFAIHLKEEIATKVEQHANSPLNEYIKINPSLQTPLFYKENLLEYDRRILIKYRSGSHDLKIRTGYFTRTPEANRLCRCNEIQTLEHVLFHCPHTATIRQGINVDSLEAFFTDVTNAVDKLKALEIVMNLRRC